MPTGEIRQDYILRSTGLGLLHRQHEQTGQQLVVIGADHSFKKNFHATDIQDCIALTNEFCRQTDGTPRELYVEGRLPMIWHFGKLVGGDRVPVIDSTDLYDAACQHQELGVVACFGVWDDIPTHSIDDDRRVILQVEADGFDRMDIMRYLTYRMIPQWARSSRNNALVPYLQQHALNRYQTMMGEAWADFTPSLEAVMGPHADMLAHGTTYLPTEQVRYFLDQTINYADNPDGDASTTSSATQRVATSFTTHRDAGYASTLSDGWGDRGTPHRLAAIGMAHLKAIAPALDAL